ncbi:MAG: ComEC/Rec2 family competence protein [Bacteroidota bacterium]|nr:ComEC/Rec2 family competence protein [Bacteroidota bacterium]
MAEQAVYFWRKTPFIRLLVPLAAGIILQWHWPVSLITCWILLVFCLVAGISFSLLSFFYRYRFGWLNGIGFTMAFLCVGAILTGYKDIRYSNRWFRNFYTENTCMIVSLDEPLVEKTKSFKTNADVLYILKDGKKIKVKGKIIVYFRKDQPDSLLHLLDYGTELILNKPLQEIKSPGNPAGFDYKQYCLFQGITHQVYLQRGEFEVTGTKEKSLINSLLNAIQEKVLRILRTNIKKEKEMGLAEALLIGYKDDLDKSLVQSYSNTGVVHIIAISGMHLGLIYWLLVQLLRPLRRIKYTRLLQPIFIISGLWLFSLLAGGQPSVFRSAVMFTCIVAAQSFKRKGSIYNTLAFSAFILLCYDPFWLWDAGFQLSYSAVVSIVIFMKPIYNWFDIKNKLLDLVWKLNAVSLAAQILTVPFSLYHFHQFPVYFLLTNFMAVPLSSIIVLGEILLCGISFIPSLAVIVGKILLWLIRLMDNYVQRIELLPFSLWDGLQINISQAILLFAVVAGISYWLMEKRKYGLVITLVALIGFFSIRSYSFLQAGQQQKIIVYNVPQHCAIDFIDGRNYIFYGDADLQSDDFARNFNLRPSRVLNRVSCVSAIKDLFCYDKYVIYKTKRILFIDTTISFSAPAKKYAIDLLIISKNPKLYMAKLATIFRIRQVVFDASVPYRKLAYWKKDCDSLHIPYHNVNEKGAFVMNLN